MNAKISANLTTGEVKATVTEGGLQIVYGNAPDAGLVLTLGEDVDEQDETGGG